MRTFPQNYLTSLRPRAERPSHSPWLRGSFHTSLSRVASFTASARVFTCILA